MSRPTICRVCLRALDTFTDENGVTYLHPIADPADHEPVPVPAPPGWTGGRCDFCSAEPPRFELPARDFAVPDIPGLPAGLGPVRISRGGWAACDLCALLIQANRWTALERRSATAFEQRHGFAPPEPARTANRALYRKLRQHISGALKPIDGGGN